MGGNSSKEGTSSAPTSQKPQKRTLEEANISPPKHQKRPKHPDVPSVHIMSLGLLGDFITIENTGEKKVNMKGWEITSNSTKDSFTFPDVVLEAGARITVWSGKKNDSRKKEAGALWWSSRDQWDDGGDTAILKDSRGKEVDRKAVSATNDITNDAIDGDDEDYGEEVFARPMLRAERYYRQLVSHLVEQRLFAGIPNIAGRQSIAPGDVAMNIEARNELNDMMFSIADRVLEACADNKVIESAALIKGVEQALAACDVKRRALAECTRCKPDTKLAFFSVSNVTRFCKEEAADKQAKEDAVRVLTVCLDYLLAEVIETVAYHGALHHMETGSWESCSGTLDALGLQTAIRMDPDLHKIFRGTHDHNGSPSTGKA